MVVRSTLKPFPYAFGMTVTIIGLTVLLLVSTGQMFSEGKTSGKVAVVLVLVLLIVLFGRAILDVKSITIDTVGQIVTFKNLLTKSTTSIPFAGFEGYTECWNFNALHGSHYDLYLIKDQKVIYTIKSAFYSNYPELLKGLDGMNDLGKLKRTVANEMKIFFGIPILKNQRSR